MSTRLFDRNPFSSHCERARKTSWSDALLRALVYAGAAGVAFEYLVLLPLAMMGVL